MRRWWRVPRVEILGARLYLHWSAMLMVAVLALLSWQSPIYGAISIGCYLSIILIHECGHALMARRLGYEVLSIRLAFCHGACEHEAPHAEVDDVLIAWAGVLAQLTVAVPMLVIASIFDKQNLGYAGAAIALLGYVNLLVALVNLAPARGLDGATAWRALPLAVDWLKARRATKRVLGNIGRRK